MKRIKILILPLMLMAISGCVYRKEIVRPDDLRKPINFSSESARDTFTCSLKRIEDRFPFDKKQENLTNARFLILTLYRKEYFLSENAYFNSIIEKTDSNKDSIISKEEANALYKSYFLNHKYVDLQPGDGVFKQLGASISTPLCDMHAAS